MWKSAQWIRIPPGELEHKRVYHGDLGGRFAYFRCEQELPGDAHLTACITAVSRYRLWVNGQSVLSGPCKGDLNRQYYETVDLTPCLRPGKNVFAVRVLFNDPDIARDQMDTRAAINGVVSPGNCHALALDGDITDPEGKVLSSVTTGQADWRVWLDHTFYLRSTQHTNLLGAVEETIDFRLSPNAWKALLKDNQTAYIRLGRNPVEDVYEENSVPFEMNKATVLSEGTDVLLVAWYGN